MRLLFAIIFISIGALAQTADKGIDRLQSSCGPANEKFDVQTSKQKAQPAGENNKAQLIIVEQFDKVPGEFGKPTLRIGVDGQWVGATRDNSYFPFSVDAGEHGMCVQWQSRLTRLSQIAAFAQVNAEAGKTYYYRATVKYPPKSGGKNMRVVLEPITQAEGEYLVNINPLSTPKRAK